MDPHVPNNLKMPVFVERSVVIPATNRWTPPSARDAPTTITTPSSKPPPNLTQSSPESPEPPAELRPKTPVNSNPPLLSQKESFLNHDSSTATRPKSPKNSNPDFLNRGYKIPRLTKPPVQEGSFSVVVETDSDGSESSKNTVHPRPTYKSQDQPEVELIPRRHSEEQRTSQNMKTKPDDEITITPVVKRIERAKTPVTRAKTPSEFQEKPVTRPKTPVTRSKTPVERPKTPEEREKTPVERPKTPAQRINPERKRRKSVLVEREDPEMDAEVEKIIEEAEDETRNKRQKNNRDNYCWKCHKDNVEAACSTCVRSWHRRCIGARAPSSSSDNWICGECASILKAENSSTRSPLMASLTVDQLCMVLKHIINKMKQITGADVFMKAVNLQDVPNYLDFIVKPMDLALLDNNVKLKEYGSPDAFMADAKWILHNCIVFNTEGGKYTDTSKLTAVARSLIKLAREEVSELESCPTCYIRGRHLPRPHYTWFIDACKPPHLLVWAKLKGFPFWPAKVMPRWNKNGHVDVRFFGEHNRAWVAPKDLYLLSKDPPTATPRSKKEGIADCLREMSIHIKRLGETFGTFEYALPKTQFNPYDPMQIKSMLPDYDPPAPVDYLLPRRYPIGRGGRKRRTDSPVSVHDGTFYSDSETVADFNDYDDDDDAVSVMTRNTTVTSSRFGEADKGLPEASIPGKRSRQLKPIRSGPARRATASVKGKSPTKGATRGSATASITPTDRVMRTRSYIPDKTNNEESIVQPPNKRAKTSKDDHVHSQAAASNVSLNIEETEQVKRHSRAKKSFPNKPPPPPPPPVIARVSLERQDEEIVVVAKNPMRQEERYQIPPADAGPLSSLINRGAESLAKQMGLIIEESIKQAAQGKGPVAGSVQADQAIIHEMKMKMERMKWEHEQEMAELKHNSEKEWKEVKISMEAEHLRYIEEILKKTEKEKLDLTAELKRKQWCSCCGLEACMHCCWNTSYCSEKCQELHWRAHSSKCMRSPAKRAVAGSSKVNGQKEKSEAIAKPMNAQSNPSNVRGA